MIAGHAGKRVRCDRETDCTSTNGLVAVACPRAGAADPDTNRSMGLHSLHGVGRDCRPAGLAEFTNCRSDLSMHLREHVYAGTTFDSVEVGLIGWRWRSGPSFQAMQAAACVNLSAAACAATVGGLPGAAGALHLPGGLTLTCLASNPASRVITPTGCGRSCWPWPRTPFASPRARSVVAAICWSRRRACPHSSPQTSHPGSAACAGSRRPAW